MEVSADLRPSLFLETAEERHGRGIGRDRIVDDIGRDDAEAVVDRLDGGLARNRSGRGVAPRKRLAPVELLLGVDDDDKLGRGLAYGRSPARRRALAMAR
jgi:hypothetical protein